MIGKLTGILDSTAEGSVVLDVNGVGYVVQCGARTLSQLPERGQRLTLLIETRIRDEEIQLYGFEHEAERQWFRLLQTVQGVGARHALSIVGALTPTALAEAVLFQEQAALKRAPGVGPKLAQRIVNELKDRVPQTAPSLTPIHVKTEAPERRVLTDALSALVNLGYGEAEAARALASVAANHEAQGLEALIRAGLKELAS
jgi:Holliday junction DNA helicase RuvA